MRGSRVGFFFYAEDSIRPTYECRWLGDGYMRQVRTYVRTYIRTYAHTHARTHERLSLIHNRACRRPTLGRSRWSPSH